MLKFRTLVAVAALATVALLVPATAQAAPDQRQGRRLVGGPARLGLEGVTSVTDVD